VHAGSCGSQNVSSAGRPKVEVDGAKIRGLRLQGLSWGAVSRQIGIARSTCLRALKSPEGFKFEVDAL
jgi:hypothetical protein